MQLVLDTSIVIELERKNEDILSKIEELKNRYSSIPKISFITYFELLEGIANKSEKNKEEAEKFIELFEVLQTTKRTAKNLVMLKRNYELPIPDLIIAAHTLEIGGILVTKDNDFKNIKEIDKVIF